MDQEGSGGEAQGQSLDDSEWTVDGDYRFCILLESGIRFGNVSDAY